MSNPESTLQQRLADIVGASADPFAKVASADPQLDAIAEATFEQAEETAEVTEEQPVEATTEEQPVEAVAKEASVTDLSVREIVASDAFQAGFRDTYAQHAGEIEYAIAKLAEANKSNFDSAFFGVHDDAPGSAEERARIMKATPAGKRKAVAKALDTPTGKPTLKERLGAGARHAAAGAVLGGTVGGVTGASLGAAGTRTRPGSRLKDAAKGTVKGAGKGALIGGALGGLGLGVAGLKEGGRQKKRYDRAAEAAGYSSQKKEAGYGRSVGYGAGIGAGLNVARTAIQNRGKSDEEKKSLMGAAVKGGATGAGVGAGVQAMRNRRGMPMRIAPGTAPLQIEAPKG